MCRLLVCALVFFSCSVGATDRAYKSLKALVEDSDIVALVSVATRAEEDRLKLPRSTPYRSATSVATIELLKGSAPQGFLVHHGAALDDVLFQQGPGTYLVFLRKKDGLHVPADGWTSAKFLRGGSVTGWEDGHGFNAPLISVELVKREIREWQAVPDSSTHDNIAKPN